jgi:hypothetical protein
MKTHQEWLKIYEKCCHLFNDEGNCDNRVRLTIGQFRDDNAWGFIEVLGFDISFVEKLIPLCKSNNLYIDFCGNYEFKLRENYPKSNGEVQGEGK